MIGSYPKKYRIELEKAVNIRNLGGYLTLDNRYTSDNFLRGDSFDVLSYGDRQKLLELGVKTIIDLRNKAEIEKVPSLFEMCEEVEYYNIPILSDEEQQSMNYMPDYTFIMGDFYTSMMQKSQEALCEIFKKMADADGKVFFHCSAGKDRTGIVSAILLKLADVDNDAIIYDYCLTEKFLRNKLQSLKDNVLLTQPISSEIVDELMGAKANNMEKVLSYIEHNYSDVSTYLMSIGLSQSEIIQLKFKMISGERRI